MRSINLLIWLILPVIIIGCSGKSSEDLSGSTNKDIFIQKIAVFPFNKAENIENLSNLDLLLFSKYFSGFFGPEKVVDPDKISIDLQELKNKENVSLSHEILSKITTLNNADAYVTGFVERYDERVGSDFGISSPASVRLEMEMIIVETGQILWSEEISNTQKTLFEDVSKIKKFIKRKGKWIKAGELINEAIEDAAGSLNNYLEEYT